MPTLLKLPIKCINTSFYSVFISAFAQSLHLGDGWTRRANAGTTMAWRAAPVARRAVPKPRRKMQEPRGEGQGVWAFILGWFHYCMSLLKDAKGIERELSWCCVTFIYV